MPVWPCGAVEEGPAGFVPSGWGFLGVSAELCCSSLLKADVLWDRAMDLFPA